MTTITRYTYFCFSFLESFLFYFITYLIGFVFLFESITNKSGLDTALNSVTVKDLSTISNDLMLLLGSGLKNLFILFILILFLRFIFNIFYYYVIRFCGLGVPYFHIKISFVDKRSKFFYVLLKTLGMFSVFFNYNKYITLKN